MARRRALWLLLAAGAAVMYLFENQTFTRFILLSVLALPVCSALLLYLPRRSLSCTLSAPERLERGEEGLCSVTFFNASRLPLPAVRCRVEVENLFTGEKSSVTVFSPVGGGKEARTEFSLKSAHSGKLRVEVKQLCIQDYFGLFARKGLEEEGRTVTVGARTWPLEVTLADASQLLADSERYSMHRPGDDPSETFRIREYVPGDPVRQIHWKLSEKTGAVQVRDFGLPVLDEALLLFETTAPEGTALGSAEADGLLDLLFSLSRALLLSGLPHAVGWQDSGADTYEEEKLCRPEDLETLESRLLENRLRQGGISVAGCYAARHPTCEYAHVAVLSTYLSPSLPALCREGRVSVLLPVGAESGSLPPGAAQRVEFSLQELREGGMVLAI